MQLSPMVKLINHIIPADKTRHGASLQVILSARNFGYGVVCTRISYLPHLSHLSWDANAENSKIFSYQHYLIKLCIFGYINFSKVVAVKEKKANTVICKVNDQSKSLVEIGGHCECQRHTEQNRQHRRKDINFLWKLYRYILGKYRYTSLELVVRSVALTPAPMANFRTCNPVRVGSSENNKEQCHSLWQCQTLVGS